MRSSSTLVHEQAISKHGFTRLTTTQTWGKPSPSPLQYILCLTTKLAPKCHFVSGLPSGSLEIPKVGILATLGAHNFVCRPSMEMRFETKLQPSLGAFQQYVAHHLYTRKSGDSRIVVVGNQIVNFDFWPFFWQ